MAIGSSVAVVAMAIPPFGWYVFALAHSSHVDRGPLDKLCGSGKLYISEAVCPFCSNQWFIWEHRTETSGTNEGKLESVAQGVGALFMHGPWSWALQEWVSIGSELVAPLLPAGWAKTLCQVMIWWIVYTQNSLLYTIQYEMNSETECITNCG